MKVIVNKFDIFVGKKSMLVEIRFIWDLWTNFLFRKTVWHVQWPVVMHCWWNATVMSTTVTNNIVQIKEPNSWRARHHAKDDLESCPCTKFKHGENSFLHSVEQSLFSLCAQWKKINILMHSNLIGEYFEWIWIFKLCISENIENCN